MKSSLKCIVPHSFGDHASCNESWCRYKQDPTNYKHTYLPYGKDLYGTALKSALENNFSQHYSDTMIKKLGPAANSQRNESFNSTVGSKNPKIRYYGGSESNDFRVACAVAQTNVGYGYVCCTFKALGIDPGLNCTKYTCKMEKKKSIGLLQLIKGNTNTTDIDKYATRMICIESSKCQLINASRSDFLLLVHRRREAP
ncbi:Hypothetical predicted protein, partial [Paramuricea clavata]